MFLNPGCTISAPAEFEPRSSWVGWCVEEQGLSSLWNTRLSHPFIPSMPQWGEAAFPFAYFVEGLSSSPLRSSAKCISIFYLGCGKWNMKVGPEMYKSKGRAINLSLQNAFELLINRAEIHSSPSECVFICRLLCLVRHRAQRGDCVDKFH